MSARRIIPPYVATGGHGTPTRNHLTHMTALIATGLPPRSHDPAEQRVTVLLDAGALTVLEIAAHLALPVSVCKVVASRLLDSGHIKTHIAQASLPDALAPGGVTQGPSKEILEEVLHGLRALRN